MATLADRILEAIRYSPLDDDVLAARLGVSSRQAVNQTARRLEREGLLRRRTGPSGKIVNESLEGGVGGRVGVPPVPRPEPPRPFLSEDEVKEAVRRWLTSQGFAVTVALGHERGIDIDARHPDGRRWIIEAKGEVASDQQQGNYFLGALGELLRRMDDLNATYGLALPSNRRYRSLVRRLPALAKRRLGLVLIWVDAGTGMPTVSAEWLVDDI